MSQPQWNALELNDIVREMLGWLERCYQHCGLPDAEVEDTLAALEVVTREAPDSLRADLADALERLVIKAGFRRHLE
jgi:hypothetical protein